MEGLLSTRPTSFSFRTTKKEHFFSQKPCNIEQINKNVSLFHLHFLCSQGFIAHLNIFVQSSNVEGIPLRWLPAITKGLLSFLSFPSRVNSMIEKDTLVCPNDSYYFVSHDFSRNWKKIWLWTISFPRDGFWEQQKPRHHTQCRSRPIWRRPTNELLFVARIAAVYSISLCNSGDVPSYSSLIIFLQQWSDVWALSRSESTFLWNSQFELICHEIHFKNV